MWATIGREDKSNMIESLDPPTFWVRRTQGLPSGYNPDFERAGERRLFILTTHWIRRTNQCRRVRTQFIRLRRREERREKRTNEEEEEEIGGISTRQCLIKWAGGIIESKRKMRRNENDCWPRGGNVSLSRAIPTILKNKEACRFCTISN